MNNKCNMLILSLLAIKLYRFFLAFFVRFWKQMQCIVSQPLPFLVLQNAYLVAKIQIYIGLEQTIILKNIIPQLLFSIILIAPLHVAIYSDINVILTSINYLSGSNSSIAQMACSSTFLILGYAVL